MTQEEKQLLLKDLCARLPYGVKCPFNSKKGIVPALVTAVDLNEGIVSYKPEGGTVTYCSFIHSEDFYFRVYLRPMSSMTEEELKELNVVFDNCDTEYRVEAQDWLNSHHFDNRGLIERGLALEAPEGMYEKK